MKYWLYRNKRFADKLDAVVSREKGWLQQDRITEHWAEPKKITSGLKKGFWYVPAPEKDVLDKSKSLCEPDVIAVKDNDEFKIKEKNKLRNIIVFIWIIIYKLKQLLLNK